MTHGAIVAFAVLGILGQAVAVALLAAGSLRLAGVGGPLRWVRDAVWGYELWLAFLFTALATGGSLFFSEIAHFTPCELCWYERICMYPLAILTLLLALRDDRPAARYCFPLPIVGTALAVYHVLVERGAVSQTRGCLSIGAGRLRDEVDRGARLRDDPVLTLTVFVLVSGVLVLAAGSE